MPGDIFISESPLLEQSAVQDAADVSIEISTAASELDEAELAVEKNPSKENVDQRDQALEALIYELEQQNVEFDL